MTTGTKYKVVRDAIIHNIRKGTYTHSQKLPSERKLAKQYGVSHMTARQAVTDLVESEMLDRRSRDGIYLAPNATQRVQTKTLHLICTTYESPVIRSFLRAGQIQAKECGLNCHIIRVHSDHSRAAIKAIRSGQPCIIIFSLDYQMQSPFVQAMQDEKSNVVFVGANLSMLGIRSVLCDDAMAMRMMVEKLKANGHKRVALIAHDVDSQIDQMRIATWRSCFADEAQKDLEKRLLVVPVPEFESSSTYVYKAVLNYLNSGEADVTAFIGVLDESTVGAMAACRCAGKKIPEDISFINFYDTPSLEFSHPGVTCVDPGISSHVEAALKMLNDSVPGELQLIEPRVVERDSIACVD